MCKMWIDNTIRQLFFSSRGALSLLSPNLLVKLVCVLIFHFSTFEHRIMVEAVICITFDGQMSEYSEEKREQTSSNQKVRWNQKAV